MNSKDALELVIAAIRELGQAGVIVDPPTTLDSDAELFGSGGFVDSLGLVQLTVEVERMVAESVGTPITLADERAMSRSQSPFRTLGSLAAYIVELVRAQ